MHPAVLVVAASAAEGFGEGFGKALGDALFGKKSSELSEIKAQLKEIFGKLQLIEAKLDSVLAAIDRLPSVIIGIYRQEIVDEAYRYLESYYDIIFGMSDANILTEPSLTDKATLLRCWRTIVELECRPTLLTRIPLWATFVRTYVVVEIDGTIRQKLSEKIDKIKFELDLHQAQLDSCFTKANAILSQGYFASFTISGKQPIFDYVVAPAPQVARYRGGDPCTGKEVYYIPDPNWPNAVASQEAALSALKAEIVTQITGYNALYPAWAILTEYLEYIGDDADFMKSNELLLAVNKINIEPVRPMKQYNCT